MLPGLDDECLANKEKTTAPTGHSPIQGQIEEAPITGA